MLDNITSNSSVQAPSHSSRDIAEPKPRAKILLENPHQLIKFQVFKRSKQLDEPVKTDRRLTRTRNLNSLPIGAWARWVVDNPFFQSFIWIIIILNTITIGVSAELWPIKSNYWGLFQFITFLDNFAVLIFCLEILLRWIDDFEDFWKNYWLVGDFAITIVSTVPELVYLLGPNHPTVLASQIYLQSIRTIRIMKIMVRHNTLKIVITTILQAFQSMAYIMLLVFMVFYLYAIVGVYLYKPYTESTLHIQFRRSFESIGHAFMTLFQLMTLDEWDPINRDLYTVIDPVWSQLYIISWVWLGAFIFRNIFVGVMVNNFDKISERLREQEEEEAKLRKQEKLRRKLNKELAAQGNIQKSISNLRDAVDGDVTESNRKLSKEEGRSSVLGSIQKLLVTSHGISKGWEATVAETLIALSGTRTETMWPRDILFKYLQTMENLQENMKEYEDLQRLASAALMELHDT